MKSTPAKIMRDVLIEEVYKRMFHNENIFFLSADFGSPALDKLRKKFKDRFINVGIAEQNLINLSAGLALEGFTVYAYAIAPFLTMRAYEQLRVNLSLTSQIKDINVNLIGVGAGVSYEVSGPTHHCFEDISIIRTLPNFMVFSPSDWQLAESFVDLSINIKKPKYIRLDGKPLPQIYNNVERFDLENGFCELLKGEKVCIVSTGYMTHKALKIAKEIKKSKIDLGVIDLFRLKPIDETLLFERLKGYESVFTIEEAFIDKGGLDSLVLNILKNKNSRIRLMNFGFKDKYVFDMGSRDYLYRLHGFDEESIIKTIKGFEQSFC
ncbi:MAG: transketolase C-terminal domain-containing protein [bacterium]